MIFFVVIGENEIEDFLSFITNCKKWHVFSRCLCLYPFINLFWLSLKLGLFGPLLDDLAATSRSLPNIHRLLINYLVTVPFKFQSWSYKSVYWSEIFYSKKKHWDNQHHFLLLTHNSSNQWHIKDESNEDIEMACTRNITKWRCIIFIINLARWSFFDTFIINRSVACDNATQFRFRWYLNLYKIKLIKFNRKIQISCYRIHTLNCQNSTFQLQR